MGYPTAVIITRHDKMKVVYAIDYKAVFSTRPNSYTTIFLKTNPDGVIYRGLHAVNGQD